MKRIKKRQNGAKLNSSKLTEARGHDTIRNEATWYEQKFMGHHGIKETETAQNEQIDGCNTETESTCTLFI